MAEEPEKHTRGRKPGMTNSELEARNEQLVRDRLRGQSWAYIAQKHGMQVRGAQTVFEKWRKNNAGTYKGRDPLAIVHQMLDRLEAWVEQLAEMADSSRSDQTRIAAINGQLAVLVRTTELLQATGLLPHDLGTLRVEMDIQVLAARLVSVLQEQGATPELKRAILESLKSDAALPVVTNGNG